MRESEHEQSKLTSCFLRIAPRTVSSCFDTDYRYESIVLPLERYKPLAEGKMNFRPEAYERQQT